MNAYLNFTGVFLSHTLHFYRRRHKDTWVLVKAVLVEGLCIETHWSYPTQVCEDMCYIFAAIHKLEQYILRCGIPAT